MSGGGASPALQRYGLVGSFGLDYSPLALFVSGQRTRVLANKDENGNITKVFSSVGGPSSNPQFYETNWHDLNDSRKQNILANIAIYGSLSYQISADAKTLNVADISIPSTVEVKQSFQVYDELGFVEGQARISTPYGSAACVVKNGTLYPILAEYDQTIEDNWTLRHVYLNGDDVVSDLQQMVDRSGNYLAYEVDGEDSQWSPIENYLHQHVNMPIVPKIGYIPSQDIGIGNELLGPNYTVSL